MQYPPLVDLHTHSTYSDGTLTPEELVLLAKKRGLAALALTDHDTIDGLAAFEAAGAVHDLETIPGVEFAAFWERYHKPEIHIVGLGFDDRHPALLEKMQFIQDSRTRRNQKMCEKLTEIGLPVNLEEIQANAGGEVITRMHFANVLLEKGYIRTKDEAFAAYLSNGMPGYVARETLSPELCIRTIKEAGGAAVLAHPTLYGLNLQQIEELCRAWMPYGLDGIECQYSTYSADETHAITCLAERLGLLPSGGSDFHGENKPTIQLGSGRGNLAIPYAIWAGLKQRTRGKKT